MIGCRKILFTILLCLGTVVSHAQFDTLFTRQGADKYEAANDMVLDPDDSAGNWAICQALLGAVKGRNEEDKLTVEQAVMQVRSRHRIDLQHMEQDLLALLARAQKLGNQPLLTYVYIRIGDYYYNNVQQYGLAFQYYLRAYDNYSHYAKTDKRYLFQSQYELALAYYHFYDYDNALRYVRELFDHSNMRIAWFGIIVNDLAGTIYLKTGKYDSAITCFQKVAALAPTHHDAGYVTAWQGIAAGKIGQALYQQHNYDKAIPYLLRGEELSIKGHVPDNTAPFAADLATIYMLRADNGAAQKHLAIALQAAREANLPESYCKVFAALTDYNKRQGNMALAYQFLDSAVMLKDSIAVVVDVSKKHRAEIMVADERLAMSQQLATQEKGQQVLVRNGLIIFSLMALIAVLLIYNRKLLNQKMRREQLAAEKQLVETELGNAVQQLNNFKNNIAEKSDLIASLEKELSTNIDNTVITRLQQSTILTDEQWTDFRTLFEKAHPGFLQKLKEKLPGLTPAETRFMVLLKLNFTNKEMAAALGVGAEAIRITWYRLRKKLNLPEEGRLEELVEQI